MASQSSSAIHRHFLLCPVCKKTQACLPVHLRRVCMKEATPEAIASVLEVAKQEALQILQSGRVFSFGLLHRIMEDARPLDRLIEELERRHMVVTDVPQSLPGAESRPISGAVAQPLTGVAVESEPSESEPTEVSSVHSSSSSGETFEIQRTMQWTKQKRHLMAKRGLYQKHSLGNPLLKEFATYLEKDLKNENYKQEVENVARFLYYVDPAEPSLLFVRNREKLKLYIRELSEAKLSKQTQLNYLKSLKRFLQFHTVNSNLRQDDEKLHGDCMHFIVYIGYLQKSCSKLVSQEIVQKRYDALTQPNQLSPRDCWAVLDKAKADFLKVIGKVFPVKDFGAELEQSECLLVLYYLEAIVILKHLQRPGVVEHMTMSEWEARTHDPKTNTAVVGVKQHKTSAQQVATFALSSEEEAWFDVYSEHVRPSLLSSEKQKRSWGNVQGQDRFFVSSTGKPVYNASNDLNRFHDRYKLKSVTSQMARKIFETATKCLGDTEKSLVADYLTHSTATAEKHYRMRQPQNVAMAHKLLCRLAGDSGSDSGNDEQTGSPTHAEGSGISAPKEQMTVQTAFDTLLRTHPITLDGEVPERRVRSLVSPTLQRQLYERWIKAQKKERVHHVCSHFGRRLPSESRVTAWIAKQGWKSNIPTPARILSDWKPPGSVQAVMDSAFIRRLVTSQKWKGLQVADIEGKGKGVIATRPFQLGEVICDFHGCVVTAREGQEVHAGKGECLFVYTNSASEPRCIDASSCECHPETETFGRLLRHSSKHANTRPRLYSYQSDGEDKEVILFLAAKAINPHDELLFDYGNKRKSYRGEGLDLSWV